MENGKSLQKLTATKGFRVDWPHFSPDGDYFFVSYAKPHRGQFGYPAEKNYQDFDIWVAPASKDGVVEWDELKPLVGEDINRVKTPDVSTRGYVHNETAPRVNLNGELLFWTERLDDGGGRRDLYLASPGKKGSLTWNKPQLLPAPINSPSQESGGVMSKDGNWLIFASGRPGGYGGSDLYISKRIHNDSWSTPVNLGPKVNTMADEGVPELSPDNRALFFTSTRVIKDLKPQSRGEGARYSAIYWVSVDSLPQPK